MEHRDRARRAVRTGSDDSFHDVDYRDLVADPMRVVHGVYEHFGITLPVGADAAMRAGSHRIRRENSGSTNTGPKTSVSTTRQFATRSCAREDDDATT